MNEDFGDLLAANPQARFLVEGEVALLSADVGLEAELPPGTQVRYEYSPESFTGTETDYAIEVCDQVRQAIDPGTDDKLIMNLANAVQALFGEHEDGADIGRAARREAHQVFAAAGIEVVSREADSERRGDLAPVPHRGRSMRSRLVPHIALDLRFPLDAKHLVAYPESVVRRRCVTSDVGSA